MKNTQTKRILLNGGEDFLSSHLFDQSLKYCHDVIFEEGLIKTFVYLKKYELNAKYLFCDV
jgi:hypothetical protein